MVWTSLSLLPAVVQSKLCYYASQRGGPSPPLEPHDQLCPTPPPQRVTRANCCGSSPGSFRRVYEEIGEHTENSSRVPSENEYKRARRARAQSGGERWCQAASLLCCCVAPAILHTQTRCKNEKKSLEMSRRSFKDSPC